MKIFISIAAALALLVTDSRAASTISFSNITLTNAVKTNDLLLVDSALGGTNYATRTSTIDTLKNALNIPSPLPGTVIASGTPAVGALPVAADTTGTNAQWSAITVESATNIYTGGLTPALSAYPFQAKTKLVFVGDSITSGYGVGPSENWPAYLTNSFATFNVVACTNAAVSGYTVTNMITNYATYVAPIKPSGLTNGILFVWGGVNDSGTAEVIAASLSNLWVTAKGDGWQVAAMTIMPASSLSLANNQKMEKVNNLIRQSLIWDYLVDTASLIPTDYGTTIDGVHPTTNYHRIIARAAFQSLAGQPYRNSTAPQPANGNGFIVTTNGTVSFYLPLYVPSFSGLAAYTSSDNVAFGLSSMSSSTVGVNNSGFGYGTLPNVTGRDNTAVGYTSMNLDTSGNYNVGIGSAALTASTNSSYSVAIGYRALAGLKNGDFNIGIGASSLESVLTGTGNVGIGYGTGYTLTGSENVAIGQTAMFLATTAASTTAVGAYAGRYQNDGSTALATPQNSVYIGWKAMGKNNSDNNSIVIGSTAVGMGANTAVIGNSSITDTYLQGKIHVSGTTNQVIFGGTNTAPVSSAAPTKWISVQVSGESAVYRLPLYE